MLNKQTRARIAHNKIKRRYPKWKRRLIVSIESARHIPVQNLLSQKHMENVPPFSALEFQRKQELRDRTTDLLVRRLLRRTTSRDNFFIGEFGRYKSIFCRP